MQEPFDVYIMLIIFILKLQLQAIGIRRYIYSERFFQYTINVVICICKIYIFLT